MAMAGFLREDSSKAVRLVSWVWAVIAVVEEVRAEREVWRSGCCGDGSSGGGWWWRQLENLFRAMFLDIPPCLLVAPPSSFLQFQAR